MDTYNANETAKSLRDIALDLERDAKRLRDFAAQIDEVVDAGGDFSGTVFNQNVNRLLMSTMNTSSRISAYESALYHAGEAVK